MIVAWDSMVEFRDAAPTSAALTSASFRDQFNGLKDLIDAQAALIATQATTIDGLMARMSDAESALGTIAGQLPNYLTQAEIEAISASNVNGVVELALTISNPPTQAEVLAVFDKLNELLNGLYR